MSRRVCSIRCAWPRGRRTPGSVTSTRSVRRRSLELGLAQLARRAARPAPRAPAGRGSARRRARAARRAEASPARAAPGRAAPCGRAPRCAPPRARPSRRAAAMRAGRVRDEGFEVHGGRVVYRTWPPPTTGSAGATTPGAGRSPRTSRSTSTWRCDRGGPVLEIGVGSGRVAVPTALAGVPVVGVDTLAGDARAGPGAGGAARPSPLELVRGRHARPARPGHVPARHGAVPGVPAPARRRRAAGRPAGAARPAASPAGRSPSTCSIPTRADIAETHDRWIEREPGIEERALWDEARAAPRARRCAPATSRPRWSSGGSSPHDWRRLLAEAGFERIQGYGWFDRRPLEPGATDSVWVAHRASTG